jgi:hypothetical protein
MIWTAYFDESGTHDESPIMLMGGFVAPAENWKCFNVGYWQLLDFNGVAYLHGTELHHGKGQYRGWSPEKINALILSVQNLINKHLAFGFVSVIRRNDYDEIYKSGEQPKKLAKDSKIGVLFRASLGLLPEAVIRANKEEARQAQIDVVLESGGPNPGGVVGIFNELKSIILPGWDKLIGTVEFAKKKTCPGVQVADLLIYGAYRQEIQEHGKTPTALEHSSLIANQIPESSDIPSFRIPITREILESLKGGLLLREEERKRFWENSRTNND